MVLFIVEGRLQTLLQPLEEIMALDVILVVVEEALVVVVDPVVEVNENGFLCGEAQEGFLLRLGVKDEFGGECDVEKVHLEGLFLELEALHEFDPVNQLVLVQ